MRRDRAAERIGLLEFRLVGRACLGVVPAAEPGTTEAGGTRRGGGRPPASWSAALPARPRPGSDRPERKSGGSVGTG